MSISRFLICCLLVWSCLPALAQQQPSSDAILGAHATEAAPVFRVDPSAVRIVSPRVADFDELMWRARGGGSGDSLAYFDTTGAEFAIQLNSDAPDGPDFSNFETLQRFTPGYGTSPPCDVDCPRGGAATSAGQITEFGFRLAGGGAGGDGDLLLIFSKFEAGEPTAGFVPPSEDVIVAVDLAELTPGAFNVVDVSPFNLFFEEDEEWIWSMRVDDRGGPRAFVRPVLDDGTLNIGPLAELGYYSPRRSGGRAFFPSGPDGPGLYYFTRTNDNNHWWYNQLADGQQPLVDVEIDGACGSTSDVCVFEGNDTIEYTGCAQNTTASTQRVTFRVFAIGPRRIANVPLFDLRVPVPAGFGICQNFSTFIPDRALNGRYEIRVDVRVNDLETLLDYDHFFFVKEPIEGRPALDSAMPAEWLTQTDGAWSAIGREEAISSAARTESVSVVGAFPNPFARETTLRFEASEAAEARLVIYDVMGREVAVLVDGTVEAGTHDMVFDARGLASGLYVYRLEAGAQMQQGHITLLR